MHMGGADGRIRGADRTLVDFNRAGTPLVEIVTGPDLRSAEHAKRFLQLLRQTVVELGISDAEMEKGSLRFDVNVSVRPEGSDELRTRTELKNMNSFNFAAQGIEREIRRQIADLRGGRPGRAGDAPLRARPGAGAAAALEGGGAGLPLLPRARPRPARTAARPGRAAAGGAPRAAERADRPARRGGRLRARRGARDERARPPLRATSPATGGRGERADERVRGDRNRPGAVNADELGKLIEARDRIPRQAFTEALAASGGCGLHGRGLPGRGQITEAGDLDPVVDQVLAANPGQVESYRAGKEGLLGFFVGQVMKETEGRRRSRNELLRKLT